MKKILLIAFFAIILFPVSSSFSQGTDFESPFAITLTSDVPFHFKNQEGYTIIIGEVENNTNFPLNDVVISALFFDDNFQLLEIVKEPIILDVIPPLGKSPYVISSENPDDAITNISVRIDRFQPAPTKNEELRVESEISEFGEQIKISGTLTNNAVVNASQTKIHLAFFYLGVIDIRLLARFLISCML